jgi:pimeloyl-ACP methyl ester carboxylesterase
LASSSELSHHAAFVNGVKLHYVRAGAGDPIVLLHGWPQTWYMWRKIIEPLAEHYTVIAPDLRGFGESSKPKGGYDKKTVAEDIYQLVRQLGFRKLFLVGHDLGGPAAYAYASAHPQDVRRLVMLDAALIIDDAEFAASYKRLFHLSFNAEPDIAVALVSGRERIFLTHFYRDCYNPGAFSAADIDEYIARFSAPGAMRASMAHYGAKSIDLEDRKEMAKTQLQMPILALGGAMSFRNGVVRACERVGTDVRGGVIEGCAHWIAEEQPEELTRQLLRFFGEDSPSLLGPDQIP